ncbi:hypothetical protein TKK_0000301 [Trichogramma kaykai]
MEKKMSPVEVLHEAAVETLLRRKPGVGFSELARCCCCCCRRRFGEVGRAAAGKMVRAGVVCSCCCRNPLLNDKHVVAKASPQGRKNGARNRWKMAGKQRLYRK